MILPGATPRSQLKHHGRRIVVRKRHQRPRTKSMSLCPLALGTALGFSSEDSALACEEASRQESHLHPRTEMRSIRCVQ